MLFLSWIFLTFCADDKPQTPLIWIVLFWNIIKMPGENTQGEEGPPEEIEMLIEKVREHPVIYDPTLPDYKNSGRKDLLWLNVASELNKEVSWCKAKWRYLKDNYKRKKTQLKGKSGDAAKKIKRWIWFHQLTFLDAHTEDNRTTGNMELDESVNEEGEVGTNDQEDEAMPSTPAPEASQSQAAKRRKKEVSDTNDVDKALIDYLTTAKKTEDAHYYFAMSIAEKLRGMPTAKAAFARMKIEQVLYEAEFTSSIVIEPTDSDLNYDQVKNEINHKSNYS